MIRPVLARRVVAVALVVTLPLAGACAKGFNPRKVATTTELYRASLEQFRRKKWDNALAGLDLLATQLPSRDTLLAQVYYHQGQAHSRRGEHLLAAQAYGRIQDAFPDDPIADRALYEQGREYQRLWRKPALDPQYGQTSLGIYRQMATLYPDSPLVPDAQRRIAEITGQMAWKDYETGMHYQRRKAWDSAIIYFKDVVRLYPGTEAARAAYVRTVEAYRAINYKEDVAETCASGQEAFPGDGELRRACGAVTAASPSATPPSATSASTPAPAGSPTPAPRVPTGAPSGPPPGR
ncbi:MAG TPA: outer membrane protein assembly factor BamD [Gemmatirosa sp.]|nr:outer membrane protein assembly factor BamD [Gemmatirosa sp.]